MISLFEKCKDVVIADLKELLNVITNNEDVDFHFNRNSTGSDIKIYTPTKIYSIRCIKIPVIQDRNRIHPLPVEERLEQLVKLLKDKQNISQANCAQILNVSQATICNDIKRLKKEGRI